MDLHLLGRRMIRFKKFRVDGQFDSQDFCSKLECRAKASAMSPFWK